MAPSRSGGVGTSVRRKEDDRFLRGRGEFVDDIKRFGMRDVAFLRSPVAHGRIRSIAKPAGADGTSDLGAVPVDALWEECRQRFAGRLVGEARG